LAIAADTSRQRHAASVLSIGSADRDVGAFFPRHAGQLIVIIHSNQARTSNVFSVEGGLPAVSIAADHRIEPRLSRTACCLNTTLNKAMDCALIAA
jgi:hypothetical protein